MANYVLAYRDGAIAETDADRQPVMQQWMHRLEDFERAVLDDANRFGPAKTAGTVDVHEAPARG